MTRLLVLLLLTASAHAGNSTLRLDEAWLREAPPGVAVNGGYFLLCNDGKRVETLTDVSSERFSRIEMHETFDADGTASMRKTPSVTLDPGKCVRFEPNGRHLMLFDAEPRLAEGESVELRFAFASGKEIVAIAKVHRGTPDRHHHH
ncbi:MAG: copper chaperone PCu(A)C [Gammaproteobacteria bacterium]|nr:copper chaperone PCu(A)C [Gammaproteobacteria bacterium]